MEKPTINNNLRIFLNSLRCLSRYKKNEDLIHEITEQIEAQFRTMFPGFLNRFQLDSSDPYNFVIQLISKVVEGMVDQPQKLIYWNSYYLEGLKSNELAKNMKCSTKTIQRWEATFPNEIVYEMRKRNNEIIQNSAPVTIREDEKVALAIHQAYNNISFQEGRILYYYFRGKGGIHVCQKMFIRHDTYRKHVTKILRELGVARMEHTYSIVAKIINELK